ncbi:hypothetical protein QVD17_31462 [Tagetes erecta]|uniref:Uncharacterized protein n=1 Tax=Tagetes erecta TaxID=13708 RepID=A0AAD8K7L8_TARER|nr:hypothetical protein QVD17_31462 [Tagetes erecta]
MLPNSKFIVNVVWRSELNQTGSSNESGPVSGWRCENIKESGIKHGRGHLSKTNQRRCHFTPIQSHLHTSLSGESSDGVSVTSSKLNKQTYTHQFIRSISILNSNV